MKKIVLTLCILLGRSFIVNANPIDSIPNSAFENWIITSWFSNPPGWETNNTSLLASTVQPDPNSYSGSLSMQLTNSGALIPEAKAGFAIQEHPLTLTGYVRNEILNNDSATLMIRLYQNNQIVDSGQIVFYGGINPNFHSFIVPLSQSSLLADSCEIRIVGGQQFNSAISFDEFSFTSPSAIDQIESNASWFLYPNPFSSTIHLKSTSGLKEQIEIELFDAFGRSVYKS